jgi:hypothetical protein
LGKHAWDDNNKYAANILVDDAEVNMIRIFEALATIWQF